MNLHSTCSSSLRLSGNCTLHPCPWLEGTENNLKNLLFMQLNQLPLPFPMFVASTGRNQSPHQKWSLGFVSCCWLRRLTDVFFFFYSWEKIGTIFPRICLVISAIVKFSFLNKDIWKAWSWLLFESTLNQVNSGHWKSTFYNYFFRKNKTKHQLLTAP